MSGKILQYFTEMATNTGVNRDTFNRTYEFDTMKKTEFMKLLKDNLGANRYKFYQSGTESFYLADENNNYLGHMELDNGAITSTFSLLSGGFYNIMFSSIFALTNIRKIYSDESLSTQAIGSYVKLSQLPNKSFKLNIITPSGEVEFNKDTLLDNGYNRVVISERYDGLFEDIFNKYFIRINTKSFKPFYESRDVICNLYLFNEYMDFNL